MSYMFGRLYDITRAYIGHHFRKQTGRSERSAKNSGRYEERTSDFTSRNNAYSRSENSSGSGASTPYDIPAQVVEDLAVFGLKPPGSLDELIKARNREMKQYHPDKFMTEDEKVEAANEIAQIYNAAFERLKEYYNR